MKFEGVHIFDYDATFRGDVTIEGNLTISNSVSQTISFGDNDKLKFGDGNDLEIYHDASNSYIDQVGTGDLYIRNTTNDKDIIFQSDDGSGGVETYFYLDGSASSGNPITVFPDSSFAAWGTSYDLMINHNGTVSRILNQNGNLEIKNTADDGDILFISDDGSGGTETYFFLDGGQNSSSPYTVWPDQSHIALGTSYDLDLYHTSTQSIIENWTGNFTIRNNANDADLILECDDGSGGVTAYLTLDGSQGFTTVQKQIRFDDSVKGTFGASDDLQISHDSFDSYVNNFTGHLYIVNRADDKDIVFQSDDGSGGVTNYFVVDGSAEQTRFYKDTRHTDGIKANFGNSDDLQIYHDGTDNHIEATSTLNIGTANSGVAINIGHTTSETTINDNLTVTGDLTVNGTTTTINSTTLTVDDKNVVLASGAADSAAADGAGITVDGASATILYEHDDTSWNFNKPTNFVGAVTVGVDDTGHDVKFFGATAGSFMLWDESDDSLELTDSTYIKLGDSGDFKMWHDGSNTYLSNEGVGHVYIQNTADDKDIIFKSDNGSGGTTEYFRLDGGIKRTIFTENIGLEDDTQILIGAGNDLQLYHNGSHSLISNQGGNLYIRQQTDDGDIIFQADDQSGGDAVYFTVDGSTGYVRFEDNRRIAVGSGDDLQIYHNASDSIIQNWTGDLHLIAHEADKDIVLSSDDGSGGTTAYLTLDGSVGYTTVQKNMRFEDSVQLQVGTGGDAGFFHDGSLAVLHNQTGHFYIRNDADDSDIILQSDDGSGGRTAYITLDGSVGYTTVQKDIRFEDNVQLELGTDRELVIYSDGSNGLISNQIGNLVITNAADDGDIVFNCDDGSGGTETYFYLDGSAGGANPATVFPDDAMLFFGTGTDFHFKHNGSNSYIENETGNLYITNDADDSDIILRADDGSGGVAAYLSLDGSAENVTMHKKVLFEGFGIFNNNQELRWKDSGGTERTILELTSADDLYFGGSFSGSMIFVGGGAYTERMRIDDSGGVLLSSTLTVGVDDTGYDVKFFGATSGRYLLWDESDNNLEFVDNVKAVFGSSAGLEVFKDGTNSYLRNWGGDIIIENNADDKDIIFKSDDGSGGVTEYFRVDGSSERTVFSKEARFSDNVILSVGSGQDLKLLHDGTNTVVDNFTGDLYFRNYADDKDIIFQSDDASGGVTTYFYLDGSLSAPYTRFPDSSVLAFGTGADLAIQHNGTSTFIQNYVGDFYIDQNLDDGDIIFRCDDGSGGVTPYITLDGSAGYTTVQKQIRLEDSVEFRLGTGGDSYLTHNGSNFFLVNDTGDLTIKNSANDKDIIFQCDDGSGGTETYFYLDGSASGGNPVTIFPDNSTLRFGTGGDLQLYHANSNSYVAQMGTGDLYIRNTTDDKDVILQSDDGSGGVTAYITLDGSSGYTKAHKHILYEDDAKAMFGTGGDMQILHDGSNSYISQNVTGALYIENNATDGDVILRSDDGSGGTATYLTLDGGLGYTVASKLINFSDNVSASWGAAGDLSIRHDGTDNLIAGSNGHIYITNSADDKDIILRSDDGSGGVTAYITLDGSAGRTVANKQIRFPDSIDLAFGGSTDFQISHNGSETILKNNTGHVYFDNYADDQDIYFRTDDGSGGIGIYFYIHGSSGTTKFSKPIEVGVDDTGHDVKFFGATSGRYMLWDETNDVLKLTDNTKLYLGDGADIRMFHDSSDSYIQSNGTGDLYIQQYNDDKDIIFQSDDGSGGVTNYIQIDGSETRTTFNKNVRLNDNVIHQVGSAADLQIYHDATDSWINNATGDLLIVNNANDEDIVFYCDDGSGGVTPYFRLDGSQGFTTAQKHIRFEDDVNAQFGTGGDMGIYHNGSNGFIKNDFGDLTISNTADDKDIIFQSDDGSGGIETYFYLDGSTGRTRFNDSKYLVFGTDQNLFIVHDGTDSFIQNYTSGDFYIDQRVDDKDIVFRADDGSGGTTEYLRIDGGGTQIVASKDIYALDNIKLRAGNAGDLSMLHNGTNSFLQNETGNLTIVNYTDDGDIIFQSDDGSGGVETYFYLDGSFGSDPYTIFPDSSVLALGTGGDLRLYHDGSHNYIKANGTGNLYIMQQNTDADISFWSDDGSGGDAEYLRIDGGVGNTYAYKDIRFVDSVKAIFGTGGDVNLYHDGSNMTMINSTGSMAFYQAVDDGDMVFYCDDGSGGNTAYITLDGSATTVNVAKKLIVDTGSDNLIAEFKSSGDSIGEIRIADNAKYTRLLTVGDTFKIMPSDGDEVFNVSDTAISVLTPLTVGVDDTGHDVKFFGATSGRYMLWDESDDSLNLTDSTQLKIGASADLRLYHDGSDSYVRGYNTHLIIMQDTADKDIIFKADDGSGGTEIYFFLDGSASSGNPYTIFPDNSLLSIGTGKDFILNHNGTNTNLGNYTGDLEIVNYANDKDVLLKSDDGSGGTTAYLTLDGSVAKTIFSKPIEVGVDDTGYDVKFFGATSGRYMEWDESADSLILVDNVQLQLGSSSDIRMLHDGTDSKIRSTTSDLYITQEANDKDIILQSDDGSGGLETYFYLDGSNNFSQSLKHIRFADNASVLVGSSSDLSITHDGTNSVIANSTGNLQINQNVDDGDLILQCDDGSGGTTAYLTLDGSATTINVAKNMEFADDVKAFFGTDNDGSVYVNGGNLYIDQDTNDKDIIFRCDDGSGGTGTYFQLDGSQTQLKVHQNMVFFDDVKGYFGTGADLGIYHNASHSYIQANGTGDLIISQDTVDQDIIFKCDNGAGGSTTYFRLDGSAATHDGSATTNLYTNFPDNSRISIGNSHDLTMHHNGTDTYITNNHTGHMIFTNYADDKDIYFRTDDGSGGVTTYLTFDGSHTETVFSEAARFADDKTMSFGTSSDLQIHHNGSNSYITQAGTGDLYIMNTTNDEDIIFVCDDGAGGNGEYFRLDGSQATHDGSATTALVTQWPDNSKIAVGAGTDGRFWHDGSHTYLQNTTGDLIIQNFADDKDIIFKSDDGSGGTTAYLTLDGSTTKTVFNKPSQRTFEKSSTTDGDANGDIVYFGGTTSMTTGAIYHYKSDGTWELADADAASTCDGLLGVALGAASDTNGVLLRGMVTLDHDPGAVGDVLFLSTTAGDCSATAPSGNGDIVRVVGYCLDASNGQIYFNPDGTFVEVSA